jgi:integral membrane sensor domain MASE1
MNPEERNQQYSVRRFAEIIAVALIYYLAGRLGRTVAPPPGIATVFWPPSGIAIAAMVMFGNRVWPGVWLGAFLSNNWSTIDLSSAGSIFSVVAIGSAIDTGALLQSLLGATLIRRFLAGDKAFERFNDTLKFCGIALMAGLVGSTIGVVSLWLGGALPTHAAFWWWRLPFWCGAICTSLIGRGADGWKRCFC